MKKKNAKILEWFGKWKVAVATVTATTARQMNEKRNQTATKLIRCIFVQNRINVRVCALFGCKRERERESAFHHSSTGCMYGVHCVANSIIWQMTINVMNMLRVFFLSLFRQLLLLFQCACVRVLV